MVDLLHVVPFLSPFALFDPDDGLFEAAPDMIEILSSLEVMSCRTGLTSQRTANRFRRLQICEYFLAAHVCAFYHWNLVTVAVVGDRMGLLFADFHKRQ